MSAASASLSFVTQLSLEADSFELMSETQQTTLLAARFAWFTSLGLSPTDAVLLAVDPRARIEDALIVADDDLLH